jgi:hypothetical protein
MSNKWITGDFSIDPVRVIYTDKEGHTFPGTAVQRANFRGITWYIVELDNGSVICQNGRDLRFEASGPSMLWVLLFGLAPLCAILTYLILLATALP